MSTELLNVFDMGLRGGKSVNLGAQNFGGEDYVVTLQR
jgi:hypothetical protein